MNWRVGIDWAGVPVSAQVNTQGALQANCKEKRKTLEHAQQTLNVGNNCDNNVICVWLLESLDGRRSSKLFGPREDQSVTEVQTQRQNRSEGLSNNSPLMRR